MHELHEHVAVVTKKLSNLLFIQRRALPEILSRSLCNFYVTFNSILIQPMHSGQFVRTMKSRALVLIDSLLCILQDKNYVKRYFMHGELSLPKIWFLLHEFIWNCGCLVWYKTTRPLFDVVWHEVRTTSPIFFNLEKRDARNVIWNISQNCCIVK